MANEFDRNHPLVSLQFELANPSAGATTDMTLAQGGTGFVVPAGYKFSPVSLTVVSNADLTAGTLDGKVTDDGTEIVSGPEPQLADTVQRATAVVGGDPQTIAAAAVVGVSVTTSAGYLPITADIDAVLLGYLLPA